MMQPTMPTMHSTTTSSPPLGEHHLRVLCSWLSGQCLLSGPADHATAVPAAEMATDELHLEQQTAQPEEPLPEVLGQVLSSKCDLCV